MSLPITSYGWEELYHQGISWIRETVGKGASAYKRTICIIKAIEWKKNYNEGILCPHGYDDVFLDIELSFRDWEKALNVPGCIPFVSNISAIVRAMLGSTIMVIGIAKVIFDSLVLIYQGYQEYKSSQGRTVRFSSLMDRAKRECLNDLRLFSHGMADIIRAIFEFIPFVNMVCCISYELSGLRLQYNVADVPRTLRRCNSASLVRNKSQMELTPRLYPNLCMPTDEEEENPTFAAEQGQ